MILRSDGDIPFFFLSMIHIDILINYIAIIDIISILKKLAA